MSRRPVHSVVVDCWLDLLHLGLISGIKASSGRLPGCWKQVTQWVYRQSPVPKYATDDLGREAQC
jgi:hypothetical protein